jgi:hypothetical protein
MNEGRLNGGPIGNLNAEEIVNPTEPMEFGIFAERPNVMMEDNVLMEEGPVRANDSRTTRTVVIEAMHYGYIVKLDCHKFAFESVDRALKYITEYLKDPTGTEEKWWKNELF